MPEFLNLDDNESIYFSRELEKIKKKTYDIKYPEFKGTRLIPTTSEAGKTAETITYRQYDSTGMAKILGNYSDNLPKVSTFAKEYTSRVKPIGASFDYSIQDIRRSIELKKDLPTRKASAARRAHEQQWDNLVWKGNKDFNLQGFLYDPNTTKTVPTTGVGGDTWALKTPQEILNDLNKVVIDPFELTKGVEIITDILLPIKQFSLISTTRLASGTDTTILEFFLKNNPTVKRINWVDQLKDVDPLPSGGAGPKDLMIGYNKNPDKLEFNLPQPYEQMAPEPRGLIFEVATHSRAGGTTIYYPLSVIVMEGI